MALPWSADSSLGKTSPLSYGDYVSYKPTVSATTWPLFAVPAVLVLLALLILRRRLRRAR